MTLLHSVLAVYVALWPEILLTGIATGTLAILEIVKGR